jgi:hypothetical protein
MVSQAWDFMCASASRANRPRSFHDASGAVVMRTADPRVNPDAVAVTESSTAFRRAVERRWHYLGDLDDLRWGE